MDSRTSLWLLSGWSGGTKRSWPQNHWLRDQGNAFPNGGSASTSYRRRGVAPPASATAKRPPFSVASSSHAATRRANLSPSSIISIAADVRSITALICSRDSDTHHARAARRPPAVRRFPPRTAGRSAERRVGEEGG